MKRMYIAILLVIISLALGIVEITTVHYSSDKCIEQLELIDDEIKNNNTERAVKLCKKAIEKYDEFTEKVMYCYYQHSSLEEISQNLAMMEEALKSKDINRYKLLSVKTKKQLQAIKDEELLTIQNIL